MGCLGALLLLLGALGARAEICGVPKVDSQLVEKLGQRLLPWMDWLSLEHLNPSIYVGLRLSSLQAGTKEDLYLHSLKLNYQQCLLGSASGDDTSDCQAKPSMGQLALYLLALRANCEFVGGRKGDRLVSQLKWFLEEEKRAIGEGSPAAGAGSWESGENQSLGEGALSPPPSHPSPSPRRGCVCSSGCA